MGPGWSWTLLVAGAVLILVEVAFGGFAGFDLVLIGSAFVLGGLIGLATQNAVLGIIVASILCLAYIAVGRRWVRSRLKLKNTATNTDALLGQRAMVTVRVAEHAAGQVKLRGEVWRAVPAPGAGGPFEPGAEVTVEEVDGVTLQVR
jgi:membrane protein implicated in regulation of membrane protease activity